MTNKTCFYNENEKLCYLSFEIDNASHEVHIHEVDAVTHVQLYKGTVQMVDCYDQEHFLDQVADLQQTIMQSVA